MCSFYVWVCLCRCVFAQSRDVMCVSTCVCVGVCVHVQIFVGHKPEGWSGVCAEGICPSQSRWVLTAKNSQNIFENTFVQG